jgi:Uma2 family endonuclease
MAIGPAALWRSPGLPPIIAPGTPRGVSDMPQTLAYKPGPVTIRMLLDFLETRPEEERWELIDGEAIMMPPPKMLHQLIASNLERRLNEALEARKPDWLALREIGIELPDNHAYRPEPEITVVDAGIDLNQSYTDRFYLVAEVLSQSDKPKHVALKVSFYRSHPPCRMILIIREDTMHVEMHRRGATGEWETAPLAAPGDVIALEKAGQVCTLAQLYARTPLAPGPRP